MGLPRSAEQGVIRAQYRKLTLQFHPDKVVTEAEATRKQCELRFKEIAHAYSVLSDPAAKQLHDSMLR